MIGHGEYGPGAFEEVTVPPSDEWREAQERDVEDPADIAVDLDELRDGGPTQFGPAVTTTGGTAGPASSRRRPASPGGRGRGGKGKVAQITTGDATTGEYRTPSSGSTSDAEGPAGQIGGNFTDR
ncbi:MAG TPA: hypothetical protein VFX61_17580 [Micromonosporaceae bacterium]|nr:hypothetical protein [Micromonosporaceae bacterium]